MNVAMSDNSIAFDGTSPDNCDLSGLNLLTAINQYSDQFLVDGVDWLPWRAPHPSDTEVQKAFRKPSLWYEVENNGICCFLLWCSLGPALMERMENECSGYLAQDDGAFLIFTEGLLEPVAKMYQTFSRGVRRARTRFDWNLAAEEFEVLWEAN